MASDSQLDVIKSLEGASFGKKLGAYAKLSGPGWIQAAVTLGGGSLVGALYLGVVGGFQFMWLQPLAMLCGVIMLAAISHVTLSSEDRPFVAAKKNISPTLAWGWLIATVIADVVFCAAQYSLGTDAIQGNLGILKNTEESNANAYIITGIFTVVSLSLLWMSLGEGKAARRIENVLKGLVAIVVLAFMGVVITLGVKGGIAWGALFKGLIPDFTALFKPADTYSAAIAATGEQADYWTKTIANTQRNVIIAAFGAAVGINMTFLLPYTLKKRGWGKPHRELSRFDLVLGLFVPFILATSFLVIATSSQFHAQKNGVANPKAVAAILNSRLAAEDSEYKATSKAANEELTALLEAKVPAFEEGGLDTQAAIATLSAADQAPAAALYAKTGEARRNALPQAEKDLGVMLAKRNASDLAESLKPFLGDNSQLIFGIGVLAMAVSTMLVHMMMNGYAISEAFGKPGQKTLFMFGAAMPAAAGFFSPILWAGDPSIKTAISVPAGVMAATLLPIAYLIFILLMNSKKTLGSEMPRRRGLINVLMIIAGGVAAFASVWNLLGKYDSANLYTKYGALIGLIAVPLLLLIGIAGYLRREKA